MVLVMLRASSRARSRAAVNSWEFFSGEWYAMNRDAAVTKTCGKTQERRRGEEEEGRRHVERRRKEGERAI